MCGREKDIASLPLLLAFCAIRLILNAESMLCCIREKKDGKWSVCNLLITSLEMSLP